MLHNSTGQCAPGPTGLICLNRDLTPQQRKDIIDQWQRVFEADTESRADQHPEYAIASAAARGRPLWIWPGDDCGGSQHSTSMAVLEERSILIRPLSAIRRLKCRIRVLRLVGARLLGEQSEEQCEHMLQRLQQHLKSHPRECQAVFLEEIDVDTAVGRAIHRIRETAIGRQLVEWSRVQPHWYVRFPDSPADYWQKFSGRRRHKLRREQRLCGGTLRVVTAPEEVVEFVKMAEVVSQRSWQGREMGLRVRNDESTVAAFKQLAELCMFRAYLLLRDGEPIAFTYGTLHNKCYMFEETAYDSEASDMSPGKVLLMEIISDLIQVPGIKIIDFGYGNASYKEQFGTDSGAIGSWLFLGPGIFPAMMVRTKALSLRLRNRVVSSVTRFRKWRKVTG